VIMIAAIAGDGKGRRILNFHDYSIQYEYDTCYSGLRIRPHTKPPSVIDIDCRPVQERTPIFTSRCINERQTGQCGCWVWDRR
jgi:hypothetical protein